MADTAPTVDTKSEDWPLFAHTLSRKTTEQLQIWTDRFDRGVINLVTMISIVSALYDSTSGLIEMELSNLLADIHRDLVRQAQKKS